MAFDILNFPLFISFSIFIGLSVIIIVYLSEKYSKYQPNYNSAIPVIEIVKAVEKLCPISSQTKWKLFPFDHGCHRCWSQSIILPILQSNINVYGSATTINASPAGICTLIADVSKWSEWNPFFTSQYVVKPFNKKSLQRDHFMEAEQVISIVREMDKIQSHVFMYRFFDFSESKVGWFLLWNPKKLEFLYFLVQPIKNNKENSLCLLTHLMGTESTLYSSCVSLVSQRLRNIQDLLTLSPLCFVPSTYMTSFHSNSKDFTSMDQSHSLKNNNQESSFLLSSVRSHKRESLHTVFILVPFVQSIFEFWKINVEFKLAVKNMESISSRKKPSISSNPKEKIASTKSESRFLRRAVSDVGINSNSLINLRRNISSVPDNLTETSVSNKKLNTDCKNIILENPKQSLDTRSEDCETKNVELSKKMLSKAKFQSLSAVNNVKSYKLPCKSGSDNESFDQVENLNENTEDKLVALDEQENKEMFNSSISDFEVVESCEFTENRIAGFMTQGNYGAAELQAEVLVASQFLYDMNSGNYQSVGGWMFHSYYKGICVLHKITCSQFLRITSFLCQTEIPIAPKDLWKLVKCPQFRFICDESVKRVDKLYGHFKGILLPQETQKANAISANGLDYFYYLFLLGRGTVFFSRNSNGTYVHAMVSVEVLEKISNSQKLIHTYHEVAGFIKKELVDFCLLQTEREEVNKYYSCFCSIEFDKCPFMQGVTRGTLRPSGWIIERADEDPNRSILTYVIQGLISSPDSLFIQDLSTMVPQSVHNLKNYIISKPM